MQGFNSNSHGNQYSAAEGLTVLDGFLSLPLTKHVGLSPRAPHARDPLHAASAQLWFVHSGKAPQGAAVWKSETLCTVIREGEKAWGGDKIQNSQAINLLT